MNIDADDQCYVPDLELNIVKLLDMTQALLSKWSWQGNWRSQRLKRLHLSALFSTLRYVAQMSPEAHTPPHRPTYGVRLSDSQLAAIVNTVFPRRRLLRHQELGREQSFNNRIYFMDVESDTDPRSSQAEQFVLRVCGHYFGASKIVNEVGHLLRLRHYCPSVPVPSLVAWSENGSDIDTVDKGRLEETSATAASASKHPWLIQSRLTGRMLSTDDLDGKHGPAILRQLATHISTWRIKMPSLGIGGLVFADSPTPPHWAPPGTGIERSGGGFTAGPLVLAHAHKAYPYPQTWADYYHYCLDDQYEQLKRAPELEPSRDRTQRAAHTFLEHLRNLPFLKHATNHVKFTHMDFSPRNILITDSTDDRTAPEVTGILDFEFSAYLPAPCEFLNSIVNQPDDWPAHHYETILSILRSMEANSIPSPTSDGHNMICVPTTQPPIPPCTDGDLCLCDYHTFQHLCVLESILGNIAPWWITPTAYDGKADELEAEYDKAARKVLQGIEKLERVL